MNIEDLTAKGGENLAGEKAGQVEPELMKYDENWEDETFGEEDLEEDLTEFGFHEE